MIPTSADLVTINIGGNNNDAFASVVEHCVYLLGIGCKEALQNAQNSINGIGPAISDLFTAIQKKTPNARVLVMSYVRFWPVFYDNSLCKNDPLKVPSADQKADMNSLVDQMNQVLSSSAEAHGFWFIDVNPNFEGHRLCDKQAAYIQGDLLPGDEKNITSNAANSTDNVGDWYNKGVFHPNLEGHFQYRMLIESALGCGA